MRLSDLLRLRSVKKAAIDLVRYMLEDTPSSPIEPGQHDIEVTGAVIDTDTNTLTINFILLDPDRSEDIDCRGRNG